MTQALVRRDQQLETFCLGVIEERAVAKIRPSTFESGLHKIIR